MSHTNKIPFSKAITYILISIFVFSLLPTVFVSYFKSLDNSHKKDNKFLITDIIQTGPVKEALKSQQLEELLGLSIDQPQNLYAYNLLEGEKKLLNCPVIKEAKLAKEFPDTLVVDYSIREPLAYISDYENIVIDEDGFLFPLSPYYTPKRLPEIYLGVQIEPFTYGNIQDEKWKVAKDILTYIKELSIKGLFVKKIDVSKVRADSLGKREVILTLSDQLGQKKYLRYLRLTKERYIEEIDHFLSLKHMSLAEDLVVDLRLLPNAYLTSIKEEK